MSTADLKRFEKIRFPVIFATALVAAYIAFTQRHYFLQGIEAEAEIMYKQDPEDNRLLDKLKAEMNR